MEILLKGTIYKCILIHELYWTPRYKQAQIMKDNTVFRFNIDRNDSEIASELAGYFRLPM